MSLPTLPQLSSPQLSQSSTASRKLLPDEASTASGGLYSLSRGMVADSHVGLPEAANQGRGCGLGEGQTLHLHPKGPALSNTPFQQVHLVAVSAGKGSRASLPPPLAHSLLPPVLGLRSYQITDHNYEEKDLEAAITPITTTLPPGSLCLCPNLRQHPRLGLL